MRQLIVDYIPFSISAQQINESMKENDGKLTKFYSNQNEGRNDQHSMQIIMLQNHRSSPE